MPKMKTHRGTKKRVKVTGSGKLVIKHSGKSHILTKKSNKRKKRLGQDAIVPKGAERRIKKVLAGQAGRQFNQNYKRLRRNETAKSKNRNSQKKKT